MKYSIFNFLILTLIAFSSCERGATNDYILTEEENEREGEERDCYEFVYPITYVMPDGTEVTGNNEEEINMAFRTWYQENPGNEEEPVLQFPVDIVAGEETITLENSGDLRRIEARCFEDGGNCYDVLYPITYLMPDGTEVTGNNREEVGTAIRIWYEANPNSEERPTLQFPVNIVVGEETITLENAEDLRRIEERCDDDNRPTDYDCPDLEANIGDACRNGDGTEGTINSDCVCE